MGVPRDLSPEGFNASGVGALPGLLGMEVLEVGPGSVKARLEVRPHHLAPNGYLHAGTLVTLADTSCGYGCMASLPEGADGFTTIELKSNFLRTVTQGGIGCVATMVHGGRTTQLWDAEVRAESTGAVLAVFRCTQLVLRS